MSNPVKAALYAVLVLLAGVSGYFAYQSFTGLMAKGAQRAAEYDRLASDRSTPVEPSATNEAAIASTNTGSLATNAAGSNTVALTNASSLSASNTNNIVAAGGTNASPPESTVPKASDEIPTALSGQNGGAHAGGKHTGRMGLWLGLLILSLIGLGLLIAGDVSHYLGERALKTLYNDEGEGLKNPEYEQAEETWAKGDHLEAIRMMREYLQNNPREQHVAIRIAEIYEKDLNNALAAALEYEEVLKHKLPGERWGWAAIHLCNLYFRLNQEPKALDLLRRIVTEYPNVAAAEKARKRLEQLGELPPDGAAATGGEENTSNTARPAGGQQGNPSTSNLPPGFRPKK
jgi:tetratricopeptide (TPR) repeat protein